MLYASFRQDTEEEEEERDGVGEDSGLYSVGSRATHGVTPTSIVLEAPRGAAPSIDPSVELHHKKGFIPPLTTNPLLYQDKSFSMVQPEKTPVIQL